MEILRSNYFFAVISYCECVTFRSDNGSRPLRRIHRCCCAIDTERERERKRETRRLVQTFTSSGARAYYGPCVQPLFLFLPIYIYRVDFPFISLSFLPSWRWRKQYQLARREKGKPPGREGGSTSGSIHTTTATGESLLRRP